VCGAINGKEWEMTEVAVVVQQLADVLNKCATVRSNASAIVFHVRKQISLRPCSSSDT